MKKARIFIRVLEGTKKFKRICGNSRKKKGLSSGFVILKKGETVGIHNTGKKEEILIVLQGRAEVILANKRFILKNGMALYIPPNTLHDVKSINTRLLKYLYVTAAV
jgi:mannose-6-phosphate isomerase-like protein (cupin superfamily)